MRRRLGAVLVTGLLATGVALTGGPALAATATPSVPGSRAVPVTEPWWVPVGLRGQRISTLSVAGTEIDLVAGGRPLLSSDAGVTFVSTPQSPERTSGPGLDADVRTATDHWAISAGSVQHARGADALAPDPGAPDLGGTAHLLAAPAALPGQVVAVSDAGVVWRRSAAGDWQRALVLLPQWLLAGRPRITSLTAFTEPLSAGMYLGTDGFSVLLTTDGGEDWRRAGPGLPDHVTALATDAATASVYAATDDGLWVHHLRALPAIPVYAGPDLASRRLGTALITLLGIAAAVTLLLLALPSRRPAAPDGLPPPP